MQYKEFIKADEGFQYSINLEYDLNKLSKISGYIPTNLSVEILNEYLKSIYYDNKDRARVVIGPYGKGKSHLLLILLSLISIKEYDICEIDEFNTKKVIKNLINKIGKIDKDTAQIIKEVRSRNKKMLPIIINSNYTDLNQAFLLGLMDALTRENLMNLIPNTYFDAIKNTIENWKNNFENTYKIFKKKLKEYKLSIREFNSKIKIYDNHAYEIFKKIHPEITSGTEFNPLTNSNIVRLYKEINSKICEQENYTGMFIVFDEFSKFLESGTKKESTNDIKIIQDFAELANSSGKNQVHFTCITHKTMNDYITKLPKEKIDSWRAVEGRFKEVYFTSSSQQNYELISNTIIKEKYLFNEFLQNNEKKFNKFINESSRLGLFKDVLNYRQLIGEGCYPLVPAATYVLTRVSEKVAQNERTLFTFLSKNEKGSLMRFINIHEGELEFLTIDYIYDYFEVLFKKEVFNELVHTIWLKSHSALQKTKNKIEKNIIKAIAIIYIVNELDKLTPTETTIRIALALEKHECDEAIKRLLNSHILMKKKSNEFYNFLSGSNVNINKNIEDAKELKAKKINIRNVLEEIIKSGYVLPKRYNDEREMVRFFKRVFITTEELLVVTNTEELLNIYKSDGVIFNLIYKNEKEKENALEKIKELKDKRILICVPDKVFNKEEELREFIAIQYLKNDKEFISKDDYILQELNIYETDIIEDIQDYIKDNFDIKNSKCKYYDSYSEINTIKKTSHISKIVSQICEKVYDKTPKINNEMINKMKISSPILKARNKVVKYIFEDMDGNVKLEGKGPEVTIFRATIENKGLLKNNRADVEEDKHNINLNTVLEKIEIFILGSEQNKKCFIDLYNDLQGSGYGLRKGIIPIYISFIMKKYKEQIVIYFKDKEVALSVEVLNRINKKPEDYYVFIEKGTNEKIKYINNIDKLFKEFRGNKSIGYNKFSSIINEMQNWIQSLPKYTREYKKNFVEGKQKKIEKEIIILRKELLKFDINPREFLFEKLNTRVLNEESFEKTFIKTKKIKQQLDNHINQFKQEVIYRTKKSFDKDYKGELAAVLNNWYIQLSENSKKRLYDSVTNNVLKYVADLKTYDEISIINKLVRIVTGLNIEDWNDDMLEKYLKELVRIKGVLSNFKDEVAVETEDNYKISFNTNGQVIDKTFEVTEISSIGSTLFYEIEETLKEYSNSIDINEKRNILMKLMKKFM